jgi:hypothetical protein
MHPGALMRNSLQIYSRSTTKVRQNYVNTFSLNCNFLALTFKGYSRITSKALQIYYRFTAELLQKSRF